MTEPLKRKEVWLALALGASSALAAAPGPIVVIRTSDLAPYKAVEASFTSAVGQPTRVVSLATAEGKDALKTALAESPSLVFTIGPDAAKTVAQARASAPTLYALVPSPARAGLDPHAAGITMFAAPQSQIRAIKELLPALRRIGVIFDPSLSAPLVLDIEAAAQAQGISLVKREVAGAKDVAAAARELLPKVDALLLLPDTTVISAESFKFIAQTSLEAKIPMIGFSEGMAKAGAVLAVEAAYEQIGRKAADAAR